jgi:hypothetical protein
MLRAAVCCFLFFLSTFSFAQTSDQNISSSPHSSPVPVVYMVDGSTLTTYNVDPHTLQAAVVGTLTLPEPTYPTVVTSPNGRFFYYSASLNGSQQDRELYVYDTNASGVPGPTPVQQLRRRSRTAWCPIPAASFFIR